MTAVVSPNRLRAEEKVPHQLFSFTFESTFNAYKGIGLYVCFFKMSFGNCICFTDNFYFSFFFV